MSRQIEHYKAEMAALSVMIKVDEESSSVKRTEQGNWEFNILNSLFGEHINNLQDYMQTCENQDPNLILKNR